MQTKARNVLRMLEKKHKVKVTLRLKGRERKELAELIVKDFLVLVCKTAKIEFKQNTFTVILS